MKKITVIVRNLPFNTRRNAEALRMSVGLTLREDKVSVIFIDDGIYSATPAKPESIHLASLEREFGALNMLKCTLLGDKLSMDKKGITELIDNIKTADREEIVRTMNESDIIIPF
jgi:sulfur relay (sulfurtransferase) DsrF/TusC family protein